MKFLVTGANGFIGKNLVLRLQELGHEAIPFVRSDSVESLGTMIDAVDGVFHLAGENRPSDISAFESVNAGLTRALCQVVLNSSRNIPLLLTSSTQAELDNAYGVSKLAAESAVEAIAESIGAAVAIYRLPGVFGKWCRPNYNSVVATFCYNLANGLEIKINDPQATVDLVYVDDVVSSFVNTMDAMCDGELLGLQRPEVEPVYKVSLGALAEQIRSFNKCRTSLVIEPVGTGLVRALYATYVSYLPTNKFIYDVPVYGDERGVFVEMLKTPDAGQFSFFTALPGITRGGHYHHTKTEKFLVIRGKARFGFRQLLTNERYEVVTDGSTPQIVETVPGWTHDVTNIGEEEMVVMLWANENFDRQHPDTIACKV